MKRQKYLNEEAQYVRGIGYNVFKATTTLVSPKNFNLHARLPSAVHHSFENSISQLERKLIGCTSMPNKAKRMISMAAKGTDMIITREPIIAHWTCVY